MNKKYFVDAMYDAFINSDLSTSEKFDKIVEIYNECVTAGFVDDEVIQKFFFLSYSLSVMLRGGQ